MSNIVKKYLNSLFLLALFTFSHIAASGLPADHYYADANIPKLKENLEKIKEAADSNDDEKKLHAPTVHAPCVILIEEDNQENKDNATLGAVTTSLGMAVEDAYAAIITSASVLLNMVERIDFKASTHSDERFKDLSFNKGSWRIFSVSGTGLFLLIPQKYENLYGLAGFDITKTFEYKDILPNQSLNGYAQLKQLLSNKLKKLSVKPDTLKNIIIPMTENIVRDFLIDGHGSTDGSICGTKPENIKAFLQYLNHSKEGQCTTGFVGLFSCYSGGRNLNKIEFNENRGTNVLDDYNFTLMVFSTNDDVIQQILPESQAFIRNFFNQTARFTDKGAGLDELMKSFVKLNPYPSYSKHGTTNLPQIWLPHGKGFQTFKLDEKIAIIGHVQARIHKENNEPFVIKDKSAVLLYSDKIHVPINIISTKALNRVQRDENFWDNLPVGTETFYHLKTLNDTKIIVQDKENYPLCAQVYEDIVGVRGANRIFFPIFIPMIRSSTDLEQTLDFASITLESPKISIGILNFIRSAFFDVAKNKATTYVFIKELTGFNDIALTLEGIRARTSNKQKSDCEKAFRASAFEKITLRDVFILQRPVDQLCLIEFLDAKNERWQFDFFPKQLTKPWNFQKNSERYEFIRNNDPKNQFFSQDEKLIALNAWFFYKRKKSLNIQPATDQKSLADILNQRITQQKLSTLTTALTALKTKLSELAQTLSKFEST